MKAATNKPLLGKSTKKPKPTYSYDLFRDGLTQSALANFLTCPQKFNLSQNKGWASERNGFAIDFGDIVHGVLDKVYTRFAEIDNVGQAQNSLVSALAGMETEAVKKTQVFNLINSDTEEEISKNYSLAKVLLIAYFRRWFKDDKKRDWAFLEKKFRNRYKNTMPVPGGQWSAEFDMLGKIDGVYKVKNSFYQLETKSKGQIDEKEMMDKLTFDLQNFYYLYNSSLLLGKRPAGILYNVMRRPQLRQGKAEKWETFLTRVEDDINERPDWYFMRWHVTISDSEFDAWLREFHKMIRNLVTAVEEHEYFRNPLGCNAHKSTCRFLPVCAREDYNGLKVREHVFPELVE